VNGSRELHIVARSILVCCVRHRIARITVSRLLCAARVCVAFQEQSYHKQELLSLSRKRSDASGACSARRCKVLFQRVSAFWTGYCAPGRGVCVRLCWRIRLGSAAIGTRDCTYPFLGVRAISPASPRRSGAILEAEHRSYTYIYTNIQH
jgi:hypothetical protein